MQFQTIVWLELFLENGDIISKESCRQTMNNVLVVKRITYRKANVKIDM